MAHYKEHRKLVIYRHNRCFVKKKKSFPKNVHDLGKILIFRKCYNLKCIDFHFCSGMVVFKMLNSPRPPDVRKLILGVQSVFIVNKFLLLYSIEIIRLIAIDFQSSVRLWLDQELYKHFSKHMTDLPPSNAGLLLVKDRKVKLFTPLFPLPWTRLYPELLELLKVYWFPTKWVESPSFRKLSDMCLLQLARLVTSNAQEEGGPS